MDSITCVQPKFIPVVDSDGQRAYVNTNYISKFIYNRYDGDFTVYFNSANDAGAPRQYKGTAANSVIDTII